MINTNEIKIISEKIVQTFFYAGKESLKIRENGLITEYKEDKTPVTNGDMEINKIVVDRISELTPSIPIVSEESSKNKSKTNLRDFWLIDPIDGTYDYVNDKDEFTINAALIINKIPLAGIIFAPAKNRMFYSYGLNESYEIIDDKKIKLKCEKKTKKNHVKAVHYSDNLKPIIKDFHDKFGVTESHKMKSSLKFCVIASSEYDLYVCEPRASEWDIAAGHAILKNAGGIVTDFENRDVVYGKENFKNPSLIVKRAVNL